MVSATAARQRKDLARFKRAVVSTKPNCYRPRADIDQAFASIDGLSRVSSPSWYRRLNAHAGVYSGHPDFGSPEAWCIDLGRYWPSARDGNLMPSRPTLVRHLQEGR